MPPLTLGDLAKVQQEILDHIKKRGEEVSRSAPPPAGPSPQERRALLAQLTTQLESELRARERVLRVYDGQISRLKAVIATLETEGGDPAAELSKSDLGKGKRRR